MPASDYNDLDLLTTNGFSPKTEDFPVRKKKAKIKTARVNFVISPKTLESARKIAISKGISLSSYIVEIITLDIEKYKDA